MHSNPCFVKRFVLSKRTIFFIILISLLFAGTIGKSQSSGNIIPEGITKNGIEAPFRFLSSHWFEGRKTGERGNEVAGEYLASEFGEMGLLPFQSVQFPKAASNYREDDSSFYQWVPMFRMISSTNNPLIVSSRNGFVESLLEFRHGNDFVFYTDGAGNKLTITAPVVFAGYGISMPEKGYDDFKGLDVAGKVVLISMGYPGYMDTTSHGFKKMQEFGVKNYSRWNKYQEAVKRGASAVLFLYTTPEWFDPTGNDYHNYTYDEKKPDTPEPDIVIAPDTVESQTPFLMVSSRVGHALLTGTGVDLVQYNIRNALECKPSSVLLKDKTVKLVVDNTTELIRSANIIGAIPGENPDEFVVVGAHYDHIGKESGEINYGSDDNASGAVAVMAIAKACREMKVKPKRTILFALWTGEEEGLLGSRFFMRHWKQGKIDSYFNFDMVSRYNPKDSANYLTINLPKGQTSFEELLTKLNNTGPDALQIRCVYEAEEDYGGSDYAPFAVRKIPFCWFFTGFHDDYHKESDTFDKANIKDMTRIVDLGFRMVLERAGRVE